MIPTHRRPLHRVVLPVATLVAGIALWWVVVRAFAVPAYVLPSPQSVAERLLGNPGLYASNAISTLELILVGGGLGVTAGFAIGAVLVASDLLRRAVVPVLVAVRVVPKIAVAPALLLYLGTGPATGVLFVALVTFFPMAVTTTAGLADVPDRYLALLDSVDAPAHREFLSVRLVNAVPALVGGLKQSTALAVVGAVVAEWVVTTEGLGALILFASEDVQPDVMLAALAVLFVEGLALYGAVATFGALLPRERLR